ncbi:hypothetical protein D9M72_579820 [compost metagenome]
MPSSTFTCFLDQVQFWWAPLFQPSETYQMPVSRVSKSSMKDFAFAVSPAFAGPARPIATRLNRARR